MRFLPRLLFKTFIGVCVCIHAAAAQTLGGQVVDSAGRPLSGVRLYLVDAARAAVDSTFADSNGTFYLSARRPGTYIVRLDAAGLVPAVSLPIPLASDAFEQRRIALTIVANVHIYNSATLQRQVRAYESNRPPAYPGGMDFRDREGDVTLEFVVDSTGRPMPGTTRVLHSSDSLFTASALRVLPSYRFYPGEVDNHPVAALVALPFHFRMPSQRCWRGPDSLTGRQPGDRCN